MPRLELDQTPFAGEQRLRLLGVRVGALRKDSDAHSLEGNSALALVKYTQYAINLEANTDQLF